MTFLVVAETLVPTGSVPGPFYLANRLRKWIGRTKRYSQIMRVLQRRGLLPYLRGSRRSELQSSRWGASLSDRQWGTVREDCSDNGDALCINWCEFQTERGSGTWANCVAVSVADQ